MKKIFVFLTVFIAIINAYTLKKGFNIVKADKDISLNSNILNGEVVMIYGISSDHSGYISFDPTKASFLNSLTELKANNYYLIVMKEDVESNDFSVDNLTSENGVVLKKGFNMVALPTMNLKSTINGAKVVMVYGISSDHSGYVSFDPTKASFLNSLSKSEAGNAYIVVAESDSSSSSNETNTSETYSVVSETKPQVSSSNSNLQLPPGVPNVQ